jgi:hypothetical protein
MVAPQLFHQWMNVIHFKGFQIGFETIKVHPSQHTTRSA